MLRDCGGNVIASHDKFANRGTETWGMVPSYVQYGFSQVLSAHKSVLLRMARIENVFWPDNRQIY